MKRATPIPHETLTTLTLCSDGQLDRGAGRLYRITIYRKTLYRSLSEMSMPTVRQPNPQSFVPLPPAALHVLLAIGPEERHGYAIMLEVERITGGAVRMGPGTLYGTVKRLLGDGLIEECGERPDPVRSDQRRRYYRVSALGRTVVANEVERLQSMINKTQVRAWARGR